MRHYFILYYIHLLFITSNFGGLPCVIKLYLIALSIYYVYQVSVFVYSPTRMMVFEKPKTFLILTPKPENGSFLFRGSLDRCFLKMNDRRATFSFLRLVNAKSYSVFVSDNC